MLKVVTIVGARPQFIKAAAVSRAIKNHEGNPLKEVLVHTGQHYDENMSQVFFDELEIPRPAYNLKISGGQHGSMTGRMLVAIEEVLITENPDWVLVYGDTNSTLAGALAAAKLHIPVAHVEAGLRSFNMRMPEEINRIVVDRLSSLLYCPTNTAVSNLQSEGILKGVHNIGDVMFDVALFYRERSKLQSQCISKLELQKDKFALATCHRAENTDSPVRLGNIATALGEIAEKIPLVLPLHPRTRKLLVDHGLIAKLRKVMIVEPLPFLDMIALEQSAKLILTDSGGIQKEAFFYGVPCVTLRNETEWVETVDLGANVLVGASTAAIRDAFERILNEERPVIMSNPYGDGNAAAKIVSLMSEYSSSKI